MKKVYILSIEGDVWGAYSSMKKAEAAVVEQRLKDGTWYIATRDVE